MKSMGASTCRSRPRFAASRTRACASVRPRTQVTYRRYAADADQRARARAGPTRRRARAPACGGEKVACAPARRAGVLGEGAAAPRRGGVTCILRRGGRAAGAGREGCAAMEGGVASPVRLRWGGGGGSTGEGGGQGGGTGTGPQGRSEMIKPQEASALPACVVSACEVCLSAWWLPMLYQPPAAATCGGTSHAVGCHADEAAASTAATAATASVVYAGSLLRAHPARKPVRTLNVQGGPRGAAAYCKGHISPI